MKRRLPIPVPTPLPILLVLLTLAPSLPAQEAPPGWGSFRLGQFIASRGRTPADVLGLDNNGEILLACREGCTRESLAAAGVEYLESQLELLRSWSLLAEEGGRYLAALPILDDAAATLLRARVGRLSAEIATAIEPQVKELVTHLEARGLGEYAYAVLFSYVLDGTVWPYLDELELVPRRDLSSTGAPWGGEVWAYLPHWKREAQTSSLSRGGFSVRVTWLPELLPLVEPLLSGPASLRTLFSEHFDEAGAHDPELTGALERYGILGADRELVVATVTEEPGNPLYMICNDLTTTVAESLPNGLDWPALVGDLGLRSEPQAVVIAYQEMTWSLMDRLVESGTIRLPAAFADPATAEPEDLHTLIVLVKRPVQAEAEAEAGAFDSDSE